LTSAAYQTTITIMSKKNDILTSGTSGNTSRLSALSTDYDL
jgi:hypothetical protein